MFTSDRVRFEVQYERPLAQESDAPAADEEWRLVHKNGTAVSNMGRFRNSFGHIYVPTPCKSTYLRVRVSGQQVCLHRLVADTFGLPGRSLIRNQVNHKNRNTLDNRLDNLEWTSASQNVLHSYATNSLRVDGRAHRSKPVRVRQITTDASGEDSEWTLFSSAREASQFLSANVNSIRKCARGLQKTVSGLRISPRSRPSC